MRSDFRIFVSCWFGLMFHISACNVPGGPQMAYSQPAMPQEKMSELGTRLSIDPIEKGYRSGVPETLQVVIRNQGEWNAFWKRHSVTNTNPAPAPNVDFDREMVVGIFLGEKNTGGMK